MAVLKKKINEFDARAKKTAQEIKDGKHPDIMACLSRIEELRKAMTENNEAMVMLMAVADALKAVIDSAIKSNKDINSFAYFELVISSLVKLEIDGIIKIKI